MPFRELSVVLLRTNPGSVNWKVQGRTPGSNAHQVGGALFCWLSLELSRQHLKNGATPLASHPPTHTHTPRRNRKHAFYLAIPDREASCNRRWGDILSHSCAESHCACGCNLAPLKCSSGVSSQSCLEGRVRSYHIPALAREASAPGKREQPCPAAHGGPSYIRRETDRGLAKHQCTRRLPDRAFLAAHFGIHICTQTHTHTYTLLAFFWVLVPPLFSQPLPRDESCSLFPRQPAKLFPALWNAPSSNDISSG